MESKKTLIIGASPNPDRYSYKAIQSLIRHGHLVEAIGKKSGMIDGIQIQKGLPDITGIHTISLYINPLAQAEYYHYILNLKPQRIIFNPGTENPELSSLASKAGLEPIEGCTLVMLNSGAY